MGGIYAAVVDRSLVQFSGHSLILGLLHALTNDRSRQHVSEHAYGVSTLLSGVWQIDSVAAAGGAL